MALCIFYIIIDKKITLFCLHFACLFGWKEVYYLRKAVLKK